MGTGTPRPQDPTRPVPTLKTAWKNVRKNAGVTGRWHDHRHTLITELAENGAGEETIRRPARPCTCHHRPGIELESSCAVEQRRGRPDAADAGDSGNVPREGPLLCNRKSQRGNSIPCGSHDRVSRRTASDRRRILLRFTAYRSTRTELPKPRCSVLRRGGPQPISARVHRASRPGYSNARERTVTCIQSG